MPLGLLPILAQTVALGVGDSTELRYVVQPDDRSFQAETRATAGLSITGKSAGLTLTYSPALVAAPLEVPLDNLTILQDAGASGYVGFVYRRSTLTLNQSVNYSQVNFALQALSSSRPSPTAEQPTPGTPPDGPGAPGEPTPAPGAEVPSSQTLKFLTATTSASLSHELSRRNSLDESVSYTYHRALGDTTEATFPTSHGVGANVTFNHVASRRDTLSTAANASHTWSESDARAWVAGVSQGMSHEFTRSSSGNVNVGASYARGTAADGTTEDGVFATTAVSYLQVSTWARGELSFSIGASYAPAIDPSTTAIDPRVSLFSGLSWWNRDRLTLSFSTNATLSVTPDDDGAIQNVGGDLGMLYLLGAGFSFASGVRAAWTTFEQEEILPPSLVFYVALSWYGSLGSLELSRPQR